VAILGDGMRIHPLVLLGLCVSACAAPRPGPAQAKLERAAWYEEQIEEGFGQLGRLPAEWASVPR
jgi:hypothetical protein